jgi:hypothetical protein
VRIFDDGLLEEVDRPLQPFLRALIEVIAALQVQVVRGQVLGRLRRASRKARFEQVRLEPLEDRRGDRLRRGLRGVGGHVERFGSYVAAARRIDDLCGHSQRVAGAADAAGNQHGGVEPAPSSRMSASWSRGSVATTRRLRNG